MILQNATLLIIWSVHGFGIRERTSAKLEGHERFSAYFIPDFEGARAPLSTEERPHCQKHAYRRRQSF